MLDVKIVSGDRGVASIKSTYIPGSSYSFSIEMDFGREPIGIFKVEIRLQRDIAFKYYSGIDTSGFLRIDVNPAFMSRYTGGKKCKGGNNY